MPNILDKSFVYIPAETHTNPDLFRERMKGYAEKVKSEPCNWRNFTPLQEGMTRQQAYLSSRGQQTANPWGKECQNASTV